MNPEQLKAYKRQKSRQFNANLKSLRLKEKAKNQTETIDNTIDNTIDQQYNTINQQEKQDDKLSLEDLFVKIEELETNNSSKIDELLETKFDEMLNKLNIIETKMGTKSQTNLDTIIETKPLRFKPIVFA